jgi:hypothetical protein
VHDERVGKCFIGFYIGRLECGYGYAFSLCVSESVGYA